METYSIYDLSVKSTMYLPELETVQSPPDASITFGSVEVSSSNSATQGLNITINNDTVSLSYPSVGGFEIRHGSKIVVDPVVDVSDQQIRAVLMGPALGFLLYQRGLLVLHGSTVERNGAAFVFLGPKGAGKSTIAGAFANQGYNVVCDDMTVIDIDEQDYRMLPGLPHLKLEDDYFGYDVFPTTASLAMEKQYYQAPKKPTQAPDSIAGVFFLDRGEKPDVESLKPIDSVLDLLTHLYLRQFSDDLEMDRCFEQVTNFARQVPVRRLTRPDTLDELPDLIRVVEDVSVR